jgi:hypothetical protein
MNNRTMNTVYNRWARVTALSQSGEAAAAVSGNAAPKPGVSSPMRAAAPDHGVGFERSADDKEKAMRRDTAAASLTSVDDSALICS